MSDSPISSISPPHFTSIVEKFLLESVSNNGFFEKEVEEIQRVVETLGRGEHKYFQRRFARLQRWAQKQDPEILSLIFALLASEVIVNRKQIRCFEATSRLNTFAESRQDAMSRFLEKQAKELSFQVAVTTDARKRGMASKLAKDPIQAIKPKVLELWKERNAGQHPRLRRVQDFATEAMRRWPVLTNAKTIEGWSARWTKQVRAGEDPTC